MSRKRIEDAPHRPLAQRGVAVEGRCDPMAADDAHHQAAAGAGVAEIERLARRQERPDPGPRIRHAPWRRRARSPAPSAWQAWPVLSTSSPSSRPSTRVSPHVRRPSRNARCEIDLSPGGRTRPLSGRARLALSGEAAEGCENGRTLAIFLGRGANRRATRRSALVSSALETVDRRPICRIDRAGGDD